MAAPPVAAARLQRMAEIVGSAAGGLLVSLVGAFVHRHAWRPEGLLVPWGVLLAVATAYAVTVALGRLTRGPGAIACAVAWVTVHVWLQPMRTEGDYLFASDFLGSAYLFGGMLAVAVAVVVGVSRPRRERPTS